MLIIDDLGHQLHNGMAVVDLPGKINLAVLPHTPHGRRIADAGHQAGKEILLHAPMSNVSNTPLGSGALTPALSSEAFEKNLTEKLGSEVAITHNKKGKGKMVISYKTLTELDAIVARLRSF